MTLDLPYLNPYDLKARLVPAVIATAPALALAVTLVSWGSLGFSDTLIALAIGALLVVFSDLSRRLGKRLEPQIFKQTGGKPSTTLFRHRDGTFDGITKARYRSYVAARLGEKAPSSEEEKTDPAAADAFYERCVQWLIAKTRDTKKYRVLFNENITYGLRRNLYGLKWLGLGLNFLTLFVCALYFYIGDIFGFGPELRSRFLALVAIALIHAVYIIFVVNRQSVVDASKEYGRRLVLSCETLMDEQPLKAYSARKK